VAIALLAWPALPFKKSLEASVHSTSEPAKANFLQIRDRLRGYLVYRPKNFAFHSGVPV
jgi:hypothetical protein